MSFETGTLTGHLALLERVKDFCETLIAPVGERWTVERYTGAQAFLASSEFGGGEAFRAFNTSPGEEWQTAIGQATPSSLGCDFVTPIDVRRHRITGPSSSFGNDPTMAPATWNLEWSDNGSAWTVLEGFSSGGFGNGGTQTFNVTAPSPGPRRYWRINIATNQGNANQTAVARLQLETDEGSGNYLNHANEPELIMRGPGLAASDEIYIGIQAYSRPTSDIYNWRLAAFTGFVSSNPFDSQPGSFGTPIGYPLWNLGTTYWLAANGQRVALVSKVETTYQTCYLGKILPYATPGQWGYPVAVAGMLETDALTRYSDPTIRGPWEFAGPKLRVRLPGATWIQPEVYPWSNSRDIRDIPGGYGVIPMILNDSDGIYGELDGLSQVSGFGNAVENIVQIGGVDHLVVHDVFRTGIRDYHTLRLD